MSISPRPVIASLGLCPAIVAGLVSCTAPAANPTAGGTLGSLDLAGSSLGFTMNKWNDEKGETPKTPVKGTFKTFEVTLSKPVKAVADLDGLTATVTVPLGSLDTALAERNANLTNTYFEVAKYATATCTFTRFTAMGSGDTVDVMADGELDLHGMKRPLTGVALSASKSGSGFTVTTKTPLAIRSADFGLPAAALMAVCKHKGLDEAATVDVRLGFK